MNLEELEKRIDANAEMIEQNLTKIETNLAKINDNAGRIEKNTLALDILSDYKKTNKRLYFALILIIVLWAITLFIFHL